MEYEDIPDRARFLEINGWKPWPCWIDPVNGTLVCEEIAVKEQLARHKGQVEPEIKPRSEG
jgi:hypothetical protein